MEWIGRLNQALDYIEDNLDGEIDFEKIAQIACCSFFHFQRMFSYIAGIPLSEYIRRRRMTAAAFDLQTSDIKIIDLALKYGYDSPTSFNRAFQTLHGTAPSTARTEGTPLKAFPRIRISVSIKGETEMEYRIEKKEAFRIVGVKESMDVNLEENFAKIPQLWQQVAQDGSLMRLVEMMDQPPFSILGVSTCMNGEKMDYYIAAATNSPAPEGLCETIVPAGIWAIFECVGPLPHTMQDLQRRIITEWLPASGYEYADAPDVEIYTNGDQQAADYRSEVWLPVVKKMQNQNI